jgi:hypothetical protein
VTYYVVNSISSLSYPSYPYFLLILNYPVYLQITISFTNWKSISRSWHFTPPVKIFFFFLSLLFAFDFQFLQLYNILLYTSLDLPFNLNFFYEYSNVTCHISVLIISYRHDHRTLLFYIHILTPARNIFARNTYFLTTTASFNFSFLSQFANYF